MSHSKPVIVFGHQMSQPSRAVWWFCVVNKIPHDLRIVDLSKGEHLSEEHKKLHPFGKVPVIDDNGFVLFESHTILRYLAQKFNAPDSWYPKDLQRRSLVDAYLDWHHGNLRNCASPLFYNTFFLKKQPAEVEKWQKETETALSCINNIWLKNNDFIAGNEKPSLADISAFSEVYHLKGINFDFTPYPNINKWISNMQQVDGFDQIFEPFFAWTGVKK